MPRVRPQDAAKRAASGYGPNFLEVIARSLRVIHAFGVERRPMTLSELARAADIPKASTGRVLYTLEQLGYVACDGRLFRLTSRVLTLANAFLGSDQVATLLQPVCERIAFTVGEACFAAVLDGQDMVAVARALPRDPVHLATGVGLRYPAFATAAGRVLLAGLKDEQLDAWLTALRPEALTDHTLLDHGELRKAIRRCRAKGYCIAEQESMLGFRNLAFPLRRRDGAVLGALCTPLRIEHCDREPDLLDRCIVLLRHETARLAEELI